MEEVKRNISKAAWLNLKKWLNEPKFADIHGEIEALIVASLMLTAGAVALIVLTVAGWLK